jgi:hypothetical protein
LDYLHEFEYRQFLRIFHTIRFQRDAQLLELLAGKDNEIFVHAVIQILWFIQIYEISIRLYDRIQKLFVAGYDPFQLTDET